MWVNRSYPLNEDILNFSSSASSTCIVSLYFILFIYFLAFPSATYEETSCEIIKKIFCLEAVRCINLWATELAWKIQGTYTVNVEASLFCLLLWYCFNGNLSKMFRLLFIFIVWTSCCLLSVDKNFIEAGLPSGGIMKICFLRFYLFIYSFTHSFIHSWETHRERQRHRQREKQAPCREPDVRLDPRTPGLLPGPKAGAKPLSHPGIPGKYVLTYNQDSCQFLCIS